jgi:hypothetical protein
MKKQMKPGNNYFIINCDEPFAGEIYKVLKHNMQRLGKWPEGDISFLDWYKLTFSEALQDRVEQPANGELPSQPKHLQQLKESIAFMLRYATLCFDNNDMVKFIEYLKRIEQRASL